MLYLNYLHIYSIDEARLVTAGQNMMCLCVVFVLCVCVYICK